jgi:hypothetical protein
MGKQGWLRAGIAGAIAGAAMALAALTGGVAEATHGVALDHFKCYLTQDQTPWNQQVILADQFIQAGFPATVLNAMRFCNPTRKFHAGAVTPIKDPDAHLTMYGLGPLPGPIQRQVLVGNQFGPQQAWVVNGPYWLAVPTQKQGHPEGPHHLDHFVCYRASGPAVNQAVGLRDEFLGEIVGVTMPALFCNPAKKEHNGVVTPVEHPDAHLACYTILGQQGMRARWVRNQFGIEQLAIAGARMLCVPSSKQVID